MENSNGPTLTAAYNKELQIRSQFGHGEPECQECGCNLTGQKVYRVASTWCCESCYYVLEDEVKHSRCRDKHID